MDARSHRQLPKGENFASLRSGGASPRIWMLLIGDRPSGHKFPDGFIYV